MKGIGFTFTGGGSYGRDAWHNRTTAEVDREIRQGAAESGITLERA